MGGRSKATLPIILAMTILVVALIYGLFIRPNFHKIGGGVIQFDAIQVARLNTGLGETVSLMGDFLYVASEEGLTKFNIEGESIWNKSYHMNELLFIVEEPYMAVVNLTGKNAFIFNEDGTTSEVKTDYTVVGGYLNQSGYLCLSLENDQENYINLYDFKGNPIIERRTLFKDDGYPIDVAMSDDGRKMLTSHLDVSLHMIESTITFLDFSSTGEEFEDKVVGHQRLSEAMVAELVFLGENNGVVISDKQLNFYKIDPTPTNLNTVDVAAKIEHVAYTDQQLIVSYGSATLPEGESVANSVVVYSSSGVQEESYSYEEPVTGLCGDHGTFYVIQSSKVTSYESGNKQWETRLYKPLKSIYHFNSDRYLLEYEYDYEIVEIRDI